MGTSDGCGSGAAGGAGLPPDRGSGLQFEGPDRGAKDGPRPAPLPTTALWPTGPFKVH